MQSPTGSITVTGDGNQTTEILELNKSEIADYAVLLFYISTYSAGSVSAKVQVSIDGGVNYLDLSSLDPNVDDADAIAGSNSSMLKIIPNLYDKMRIVFTFTGSANMTVKWSVSKQNGMPPLVSRTAEKNLFNAQRFETTSLQSSVNYNCENFRNFALFLQVTSTGTPTDIQFYVEFSNNNGGTWHRLRKGAFAVLVYEDVATAGAGIKEIFDGPCLGAMFRLGALPSGVSAGVNYFDVTARVVFFN
jgi:hypothetical protein